MSNSLVEDALNRGDYSEAKFSLEDSSEFRFSFKGSLEGGEGALSRLDWSDWSQRLPTI